jgi:ABC-type Fe3+ transport system permease subunit
MVLIARVPGGEMFRSAARALQPDIVPTLVLGGAVAVVASALGATLSYIGARNVLASARFGRIVAWAALAWPASLLCLGALSLAAIPLFRLPGFEWLPLVAVLLVRWLVLPHELWWNFWMRVPVSLEEAAWVAGMPWWRALLIVYRRSAVAVFAASVLLTACFVINDLTVFVLLAPPGFSTTTLNVFSAVHYGPSSYLAALTVCQVTAIALLATLAVCLKLGPAHVAR